MGLGSAVNTNLVVATTLNAADLRLLHQDCHGIARARELSRAMGLTLKAASTGGGSDGSFTAALGVPTLDGLGAVGEGAHAANENVLMDALPERAALLASLITTL